MLVPTGGNMFTIVRKFRLTDPAQTHRLHQLVDASRRNTPIHASWITAINAFSETFRASRNGGK